MRRRTREARDHVGSHALARQPHDTHASEGSHKHVLVARAERGGKQAWRKEKCNELIIAHACDELQAEDATVREGGGEREIA